MNHIYTKMMISIPPACCSWLAPRMRSHYGNESFVELSSLVSSHHSSHSIGWSDCISFYLPASFETYPAGTKAADQWPSIEIIGAPIYIALSHNNANLWANHQTCKASSEWNDECQRVLAPALIMMLSFFLVGHWGRSDPVIFIFFFFKYFLGILNHKCFLLY